MQRHTRRKLSKTVLSLLLFVIILTGCRNYEYFTITVLEPGELFLPGHYHKLLLLHNTPADSVAGRGTLYNIFDQVYYDTTDRSGALAAAAKNSLDEMVEMVGSFDIENPDTISLHLPADAADFTESHLRQLRRYCSSAGAQAVVLLLSIDKIVNYNIYYGGFGSEVGEFSVVMVSRWLLIDPFISKLIDSKTVRDTLYMAVNNPYHMSDSENLAVSRQLLTEIAEQSGLKYGTYLSPHYAQTERLVFGRGHRYLKRGYKEAIKSNWTGAAVWWRKALPIQDNSLRAKASFNLAIANEMEGLLEPALEWAQTSYQYFPDTINGTYVRILRQRISQQEDIILQMEKQN
jgi:hypothetical protein